MDNLERAELLINQKRYDMADEHLNKVLEANPNHGLAMAYKALIKLNTRESEAAIALAKSALGMEPELDFALYIIAMAHLNLDNIQKAENAIQKAISFNPYLPEYHGVHANIKLMTRDYKEAKKIAERGLSIDPENLFCRNMLSTAQLKLGSKDESFSTIETALRMDPDNPMTHANYGWGQLEKGSHKKAMEHFKEALAKDPENEFARAGMLEALKARFFLYRIFLKYYFWMANLKPAVQWVVIFGFIFLQKLIRAMSRSSAELAAILMPLSYLLLVFVVSTWIIQPVFNFFMSLNRYARYLLTKEDKNAAIIVGVAFSLFVVSLVGWLATKSEGFATAAVVFFTIILPFGKIWESTKKWVRLVFAGHSILAAVVGILAIIRAFDKGIDNTYFFTYVIIIVAFTWVSNFLATK